jgi:peptidoglycan-associated lipoprotein
MATPETMKVLMTEKNNSMRIHFLTITALSFFILINFQASGQSKKSQAADDDFLNMRYSLAIPKYKKAYSRTKSNKVEKNRITYQMAECYRLTNEQKRAEAFYKRLERAKYDRSEPLVLLYLADAQLSTGNYEEALENYKLYAERVPEDPRGKVGEKSCSLAIEWEKNPTNFEVSTSKKLNSREDDFCPAYSENTANAIIFTSSRDGSAGKKTDDWTGMNFTDLFYSKQDKKGEWSTPVSADANLAVNTEANEGQAAFNANFGNMYFTRCGKENTTINGCQIYVSRKQGRGWGEPEKVDLGGDSTSVFGHPAISPDETILIFSSSKSGGAGGKDLWVVTRKSGSGKFSTPRNLGEMINTKGDEVFPFLRGDTVLYFSSNGHPGMGGLDIYKSSKQADGSWGEPVNMRPSINTNSDDFGICFHPDGLNEGFFSSNRKGGRGGDDIYYFINPPLLYTIKGKITDNSTLQPIEGAIVNLLGSDGTTILTKSNTVGYYEFNKSQVKPNTTYELVVAKEKYFNEKATETTVGLEVSKDFEINFKLEPIPDVPIVLPDILYDLGKWDLKPQFQDSLQGLIQTLDANETIIVELAAHTDNRDTDEKNDILSQKRAESVVDYLIQRGIDPDRLIAKGYGERVPRKLINEAIREGYTFPSGSVLTGSFIDSLPNTAVKEAAHQMNRRTEFSIVSKDYIPKPKNRTITTGPEVKVVLNPEEHILKYELNANNQIQAECIVSGFTLSFVYDPRGVKPLISLGSALRLLKEGTIDKNSFVGDAAKILGEGTIADRAVFKVATLRIANLTINDVEIQVDHQLKAQFVIGPITLSEFGEYTIDEEKKQISFK